MSTNLDSSQLTLHDLIFGENRSTNLNIPHCKPWNFLIIQKCKWKQLYKPEHSSVRDLNIGFISLIQWISSLSRNVGENRSTNLNSPQFTLHDLIFGENRSTNLNKPHCKPWNFLIILSINVSENRSKKLKHSSVSYHGISSLSRNVGERTGVRAPLALGHPLTH